MITAPDEVVAPNRGCELALLSALGDADLVELAVKSGISVIILDAEHGFVLDHRVREMVLAATVAGGRCFARLPVWRSEEIAALADQGLSGVVLSAVDDVAAIQRALRMIRFPPAGDRSVNPFVAASTSPGDERSLRASAQSFSVWAMAETRAFLGDVHRLSELLEGSLSGLLVGPYDLAAQLNCSASPESATLAQAVRTVAAQCLSVRCRFGIFVREPSWLVAWQRQGVHPELAVVGYDRDIWFSECCRRVKVATRLTATA